MQPEKLPSGAAGNVLGTHQLEGTDPPEQQSIPQPARSGRPYLYELDRLRSITALSVVAVHVTALTTFLDTTLPSEA